MESSHSKGVLGGRSGQNSLLGSKEGMPFGKII